MRFPKVTPRIEPVPESPLFVLRILVSRTRAFLFLISGGLTYYNILIYYFLFLLKLDMYLIKFLHFNMEEVRKQYK